jgi:hypothetical protein
MPAVSNTSPLLNLAIIDRLPLLPRQLGQIWIPQAVVEELRLEEALPGSRSVREALKAGWLKIRHVDNQALVMALRRDLDGGEAEAIALALDMQVDRVLLDEREGRNVAKSFNLAVTGVLGILLRAKQEEQLLSLRGEMERLREEAGFHIGDELFLEILREGGESTS